MPSRFLKSLTERIRHLREQRGETQEEFAEHAQISYKYYQAIEAGRRIDLRLSTLVRLASAHELEVWELLLPQRAESAVGEHKQAGYAKGARRTKRKK
jgi:transcriptional regulator with XRE-family HTH domain